MAVRWSLPIQTAKERSMQLANAVLANANWIEHDTFELLFIQDRADPVVLAVVKPRRAAIDVLRRRYGHGPGIGPVPPSILAYMEARPHVLL